MNPFGPFLPPLYLFHGAQPYNTFPTTKAPRSSAPKMQNTRNSIFDLQNLLPRQQTQVETYSRLTSPPHSPKKIQKKAAAIAASIEISNNKKDTLSKGKSSKKVLFAMSPPDVIEDFTDFWRCCQISDLSYSIDELPCNKRNALEVSTCERCGHWVCSTCKLTLDPSIPKEYPKPRNPDDTLVGRASVSLKRASSILVRQDGNTKTRGTVREKQAAAKIEATVGHGENAKDTQSLERTAAKPVCEKSAVVMKGDEDVKAAGGNAKSSCGNGSSNRNENSLIRQASISLKRASSLIARRARRTRTGSV